jgi:hypothetical protein
MEDGKLIVFDIIIIQVHESFIKKKIKIKFNKVLSWILQHSY